MSDIITEKPELEILYQDEWLVAVNKPSGLFVHRSFLDKDEIYFALQLVRDMVGQHVYPLHRLDRPTSGVLLFGLSPEVANVMGGLFEQREIEKHYLALVRGHLLGDVVVDHPLKIKLDKIGDKYASEEQEAKDSVTAFKAIAQATLPIAVGKYPTVRYSLVSAKPKTGRRHQIRRHLSHLRYPIIGDINYGDNKQNPFFHQHFGFKRLMLHAQSLTFEHPYLNRQVRIEAKLDANWCNVLTELNITHDFA